MPKTISDYMKSKELRDYMVAGYLVLHFDASTGKRVYKPCEFNQMATLIQESYDPLSVNFAERVLMEVADRTFNSINKHIEVYKTIEDKRDKSNYSNLYSMNISQILFSYEIVNEDNKKKLEEGLKNIIEQIEADPALDGIYKGHLEKLYIEEDELSKESLQRLLQKDLISRSLYNYLERQKQVQSGLSVKHQLYKEGKLSINELLQQTKKKELSQEELWEILGTKELLNQYRELMRKNDEKMVLLIMKSIPTHEIVKAYLVEDITTEEFIHSGIKIYDKRQDNILKGITQDEFINACIKLKIEKDMLEEKKQLSLPDKAKLKGINDILPSERRIMKIYENGELYPVGMFPLFQIRAISVSNMLHIFDGQYEKEAEYKIDYYDLLKELDIETLKKEKENHKLNLRTFCIYTKHFFDELDPKEKEEVSLLGKGIVSERLQEEELLQKDISDIIALYQNQVIDTNEMTKVCENKDIRIELLKSIGNRTLSIEKFAQLNTALKENNMYFTLIKEYNNELIQRRNSPTILKNPEEKEKYKETVRQRDRLVEEYKESDKKDFIDESYIKYAHVLGEIDEKTVFASYIAGFPLSDYIKSLQREGRIKAADIFSYIKEYVPDQEKIVEIYANAFITTEQLEELEKYKMITKEQVALSTKQRSAKEMRDEIIKSGKFSPIEVLPEKLFGTVRRKNKKGKKTEFGKEEIASGTGGETTSVINPEIRAEFFSLLQADLDIKGEEGMLIDYYLYELQGADITIAEKLFEEKKNGRIVFAKDNATYSFRGSNLSMYTGDNLLKSDLIRDMKQQPEDDIQMDRTPHIRTWGYDIVEVIENIAKKPIKQVILDGVKINLFEAESDKAQQMQEKEESYIPKSVEEMEKEAETITQTNYKRVMEICELIKEGALSLKLNEYEIG